MNNMFFFFFDIEKRIGLKKLSNADLGLGETSRQTHIGLYGDVLKFLGDNVVTTGMLIYGNYCKILDCFFDRIENPDGTFRSPKIRTGKSDSDSIVSKIREFASENPNEEWYLLWAGLDNKDLVFWLIGKNSDDYKIIKGLVDAKVRIITDEDKAYNQLRNTMVDKINRTSLDIQKDIEIISQVGGFNRNYKPFDIEKARKQFAFVGKRGEELINEYLAKEQAAKRIDSFDWKNKSRESGLPFDFIIKSNENQTQYVDVKSTMFDFAQRIVFSHQEVSFVHQINNDAQYFVYRVFEISETNAGLRICNQCLPYMNVIDSDVNSFKMKMKVNKTSIMGMSLAVSPKDCFAKIQDIIKL